jgi:hypothetical protein
VSNGKGSTPRPLAVSFREFAANFDRTFSRVPLCPCGTVPDDECGCAAEIRDARARNNAKRAIDLWADYRTERALTLRPLPPKDAA